MRHCTEDATASTQQFWWVWRQLDVKLSCGRGTSIHHLGPWLAAVLEAAVLEAAVLEAEVLEAAVCLIAQPHPAFERQIDGLENTFAIAWEHASER
jgi:hypothetical protein